MVIERNLPEFDRNVRALGALIIGVLYFTSTIYYWWGEWILAAGVYMHVTGLLGFSPIHFLRKKNFRKRR